MDSIKNMITVPELTFYFFAILGLLLVWQYHQIQVLSGRIYAVDFWDVSGIRMLMHVAILDNNSCRHCRNAHGTVFLPSLATQKRFTTLEGPCMTSDGCRCLIVGLYGGWPDADRFVRNLRKHGKKKAMKLGQKELADLFNGNWESKISAAGDQMTIQMLTGMQKEKNSPKESIALYQEILQRASGARDLRLVVPTYLRLSEVFEKGGQFNESLHVTQEFEKRFAKHKKVFYYPSGEQRWVMATRKARILKKNKNLNTIAASPTPVTV